MLPVFATSYLPSISYISSLSKFNNVSVESHENFARQTLRNRSYILSANGIQALSIPLIQTHKKTHSCDIEISYSDGWAIKHWRSIEAAYNRSPYFLHYKDDFKEVLLSKERNLIYFNLKLLELLLYNLHLKVKIEFTEGYKKDIPEELNFRTLTDSRNTVVTGNNMTYPQVFTYKYGFVPELSIIDLLFNCGPDAGEYLHRISQLT